MRQVIFILSDEHNFRVLGCYGNKIVQTKNLDLLAKKGHVFENCYCVSPLCVPSRLCLTTGRYASEIEAWGNTATLATDDHPSIANTWKSQDLPAILSGKMHYERTKRFGFTEVGFSRHNMRPNLKVGPTIRKKDTISEPAITRHLGVDPKSEHLRHDMRATRNGIKTIKNTSGPFFLLVGLMAPHYPLQVPSDKYWKKYYDAVEVPQYDNEDLPENYKNVRKLNALNTINSEKKARKLIAMYYGLTEWMDERVGEILDAAYSKHDPIVIYSSDHGDSLGAHGMWMKSNMFEEAVHVPLIINDGTGSSRIKENCSHIDLSRYLAELSGGKLEGASGRNLGKLLKGEEWEDFAVSQHFAAVLHSSIYMAKSKYWKYVYHSHCKFEELYNLDEDPHEANNLASEKPKKCKQLYQLITDKSGVDPEEFEQYLRKNKIREV